MIRWESVINERNSNILKQNIISLRCCHGLCHVFLGRHGDRLSESATWCAYNSIDLPRRQTPWPLSLLTAATIPTHSPPSPAAPPFTPDNILAYHLYISSLFNHSTAVNTKPDFSVLRGSCAVSPICLHRRGASLRLVAIDWVVPSTRSVVIGEGRKLILISSVLQTYNAPSVFCTDISCSVYKSWCDWVLCIGLQPSDTCSSLSSLSTIASPQQR